MIQPNNIYLGNSYELIKEIPDKSIDLIITDPPYEFESGGRGGIFKYRDSLNTTYDEIINGNINKGIRTDILNQWCRVLKYIYIYIWCNKDQIQTYLDYFVKEKHCNFEILVWAKKNVPPFTCGHYLKDKEYCLLFWESGAKIKGNYDTLKTFYLSNINVDDKKKYGHPCIKPLPIINNLILNSTNEGDIILDTFLGSGSVCVAAKNLNRKYIGFEINEEYFKIAQDRLNNIEASGQVALFQ